MQIDNELGVFRRDIRVRLVRARALCLHFDLFVIRNHEDLVAPRQIHVRIAACPAHLQRRDDRRCRIRRRIRRDRCGYAPGLHVLRIHCLDRAGIQQQQPESQRQSERPLVLHGKLLFPAASNTSCPARAVNRPAADAAYLNSTNVHLKSAAVKVKV